MFTLARVTTVYRRSTPSHRLASSRVQSVTTSLSHLCHRLGDVDGIVLVQAQRLNQEVVHLAQPVM